APVFHAGQIGTPLLKGLRAADFLLAFHGGRIVACCAAWDQSETRQTHIEAYSPKLALVRPFYNAFSRMTPLKPLPAPGGVVPYFYLAFTAVEDNDPRVFRALLRELYRQRRAGLWHYFIAGFHEDDPLAGVLEEYRRVQAAGRLFLVYFDGEADMMNRVERQRIPYLEIATV
ncbi:MAG: hypothetical protein ABIZ80_13955, partial [Bryobacteraceae bacterium]